MSQDEQVLYDPTAEPRILASGLAPRLASLEGKRAGILDNSKANAGTLMLAVVARLKEKYGVRDVVKREKGIAGAPSPDILAALPTRTKSHVVEYPRRHRAGAAGDPHRGHGDV